MNPPEQKEAGQEAETNESKKGRISWRAPHTTNFCAYRETLRLNFESLKAITKLRDENNKIEHTIHRKLIQFDRERKEFAQEQKGQERDYEKCKKQLDMRVAAIENATQDCSEDKMVSLNIGGKVFLTLKSTVSNISPFFACLFSDDWGDTKRKTIRDKDGNIFIDRSPQYFEYLLDWSRHGGETEDLINIIQAISGPSWAHRTGLSTEINVKTFMKTLEYYGIDHETIDSELAVGNTLDIYWRGEKRTYKGTVNKSYFDKEEQQLCVIINYEDGTSWKYKINRFNKTSGPFSPEISRIGHKKGLNTKWWHYGEDKGGIKIISLNPRPSCSCSTGFDPNQVIGNNFITSTTVV
ncbi:MAG: hypothetical protein CXT73_05450 [Methanobacteriota archaeon]|nr:MAG: hypothetical protein CXT73_05450 [Euryarchaeota archaeon]